jgi:arginyl-tRNA synthetase
MKIESILQNSVIEAINKLYNASLEPSAISLQKTKKEFEGH